MYVFIFSSFRERREKISEIYQNIHESMHQLAKQMTILGLEFSSAVSKKSAEFVLSMGECAPEIMNEVSIIITFYQKIIIYLSFLSDKYKNHTLACIIFVLS